MIQSSDPLSESEERIGNAGRDFCAVELKSALMQIKQTESFFLNITLHLRFFMRCVPVPVPYRMFLTGA
jgi:hypothetical protein